MLSKVMAPLTRARAQRVVARKVAREPHGESLKRGIEILVPTGEGRGGHPPEASSIASGRPSSAADVDHSASVFGVSTKRGSVARPGARNKATARTRARGLNALPKGTASGMTRYAARPAGRSGSGWSPAP